MLSTIVKKWVSPKSTNLLLAVSIHALFEVPVCVLLPEAKEGINESQVGKEQGRRQMFGKTGMRGDGVFVEVVIV